MTCCSIKSLLKTQTQKPKMMLGQKLGQSHSLVDLSHSVTPSSHSHNISHTAGLSETQHCRNNDDYRLICEKEMR